MTEPEGSAASADIPAARHSPGPTWGVLAAVTVIGLVAVGLMVLRGGGSGAPHAPGGATVNGLPPTRGGMVLHPMSDADIRGVVLVPDDRAALDVLVDHSTDPEACSLFEPRVAVTEQDAHGVLLVASGYQYLPLPAHATGGYTTFGCTQSGTETIRIHLDAPLGDRPVRYQLGGGTRQPIVPADPRDNPAPSYLPDGYTLTALEPVDAAKGVLVMTRHYAHGPDTLELQVGDPRDLPPAGQVVGHATVDGRNASVSDQPGSRCLTWPEPSGRARRLCSYLGSGGLPTGELVKIARSVR